MTRLALGILVALLLIVAVGSRAFKIKTTGSPIGHSARVGETIVTIMSRLEPYVPTLNRNSRNDRYSIGLLLHSARDSTIRRFVPIITGQRAVDIPLMGITAVAGNQVWYRADQVGAYDVARGRLLAEEPGWTATPQAPPPTDPGTGDQAVLAMLIAGGHPTPDRWLGVLNQAEAASAWSPGTSIWPTMPVDRSKEPRRLYASAVDRVNGDPRIRQLEPLGGDEMLNAAFVRAERRGGILHLIGDGFLLVYESKPNRTGTIMAARVDGAGTILWTVDTGIGELREILPDPAFPVLIGERPNVPDKVSEPILLVVDASTGKLVAHSLWLR